MVWSSVSPDGSQSVRANRAPMAANTTYIETTMNVDHFWNDSNKDGHHQFVQMPNTETGGSPSDPTLATAMDLAIYAKLKESAESLDTTATEPFYRVLMGANTHLMQILGIRAMGVFDINTSTGAPTMRYAHNLTSNIITWVKTGEWTVSFDQNCPNSNYLMLGGAVAKASLDSSTVVQIKAATALATTKTASQFTLQTITTTSGSTPARTNPHQLWFVVFGG